MFLVFPYYFFFNHLLDPEKSRDYKSEIPRNPDPGIVEIGTKFTTPVVGCHCHSYNSPFSFFIFSVAFIQECSADFAGLE